jgi:hypothetical protein
MAAKSVPTRKKLRVGDLVYFKRLGLCRIMLRRSRERDLDLRVRDALGLVWDVNSKLALPSAPDPEQVEQRIHARFSRLLMNRGNPGDGN